MEDKAQIVSRFLDIASVKTCWDLGANNGYFTRIASNKGIKSAAFDIDAVAAEKNYLYIKNNKEKAPFA